MGLLSNIAAALRGNPHSNTSAGNQPGKGYPVFTPQRNTPTRDDNPMILPDGSLGYPSFDGLGNSGPGGRPGGQYNNKTIKRITLDCTNQFTNQAFTLAGSVVWFSGQNGGTAAPIYIQLCPTAGTQSNDPIQFVYDRAISGVPFQQLLISNPTAQPGVTIEITVVLDQPTDRVGMNG